MFRPNNLSCILGHVPHNWRLGFLIIEHPLYRFELTRIICEDCIVFWCQVMLQCVSFDSVFELLQEIDRMLDALRFAEIGVDELLQLGIQLGNWDIKGHILFVEITVSQVQQIIFSLSFKWVSNSIKSSNDHVHFFKIQLGQSIKLLNVWKHFN